MLKQGVGLGVCVSGCSANKGTGSNVGKMPRCAEQGRCTCSGFKTFFSSFRCSLARPRGILLNDYCEMLVALLYDALQVFRGSLGEIWVEGILSSESGPL